MHGHAKSLKSQLITILSFHQREKANLLEVLAWSISWCYIQFHKISTHHLQAYLGTTNSKPNTQDIRPKKKKRVYFKCQTEAGIYGLTMNGLYFQQRWVFSALVWHPESSAPHTLKSRPQPRQATSVAQSVEEARAVPFCSVPFALFAGGCGCFHFQALVWLRPQSGCVRAMVNKLGAVFKKSVERVVNSVWWPHF